MIRGALLAAVSFAAGTVFGIVVAVLGFLEFLADEYPEFHNRMVADIYGTEIEMTDGE